MREIKFRAWRDGKSHNGVLYKLDGSDNTMEKYELSQYTGLKDKNGVDIYEGDIVKTISHELNEPWRTKYHVIKYGVIHCFAGAKYVGFNFQFAVDECEVIGNIYEIPELLKDVKSEEILKIATNEYLFDRKVAKAREDVK